MFSVLEARQLVRVTDFSVAQILLLVYGFNYSERHVVV